MLNSAYKRGDYDWVYANYLTASHGRLSAAVNQHCGETSPELAVDLCAGTGAMTQVLVGARVPLVIAVDQSSAMLDQLQAKIQPYEAVFSDVKTWVVDLNKPGEITSVLQALPRHHEGADLVTCRQGVGYLKSWVLRQLPSLLAPGGALLFNTFVEPPTGPWRHRRAGGIYEAGFYWGGTVYHMQTRWPRIDLTSFHWHDIEEDFAQSWEASGYKVNIARHNRTLIVKVVRP